MHKKFLLAILKEETTWKTKAHMGK